MAAIDTRDTVPIPQPRGYPLVGNITDVDPEQPTLSLMNLAKEHGKLASHAGDATISC
jgi:cytochrome P450/NADPH-cytochrome P450 reductase